MAVYEYILKCIKGLDDFKYWSIVVRVKPQVSKEVVVAALIIDEQNRILIVKPNHKDGWIFPGGYVEVGESPSEACRREIFAEVGVEIHEPSRLLSVDYHSHTTEYIMFIFDGGIFTADMISTIKLPPQLLEYQFVTADEAMALLRPNGARRLMPTLEARNKASIAYLEHQELF